MKINNDPHGIIETWAKKKNLQLKCPMCSHDEWNYALVTVSIRADTKDYMRFPLTMKDVEPAIQLVCVHCAHMIQFAAKTLRFYDHPATMHEISG